MLEVVRIFGELGKTGWRPLRTIEFASWLVSHISILQRVDLNWSLSTPIFVFSFFYSVSSILIVSLQPGLCINSTRRETAYENERDGEEYNLIGSTEHVEGRLEEIRRNGFAYCK